MNFFLLPKYFRLRPFDLSTLEGRENERYRIAAISIGANVLSKIATLTVMYFSVSLTVPYLGQERFGVWMIIASLVSVLSFMDLGVGNALTTRVAQLAAQSNVKALRQTISGGLGFLFLLGLGIGLLLMLASLALPWSDLIKVGSSALALEVRHAGVIFAGIFGVSIFSNGVSRIFAGLQRAYEGHFLSICGSILSLALLVIAANKNAGIPLLLLATLGVQTATGLLLVVLLILRRQVTLHKMLPKIKLESRHLLKFGSLFLVLQIGVMIGWGSDSLIIASVLGPSEVAVFAITQRLFQMASQPMTVANSPLWSIFADACARGEKKFIRKTLVSSILSTGIFSIITALLLIYFGGAIVDKWTKGEILVPLAFLWAYGCWSIIDSLGNAFAMFLNGCNIVRPQVISVCILCLIALPLKILLIKEFGTAAMIWGFIGTYIAVFSVFYLIIFRKQLKDYLI